MKCVTSEEFVFEGVMSDDCGTVCGSLLGIHCGGVVMNCRPNIVRLLQGTDLRDGRPCDILGRIELGSTWSNANSVCPCGHVSNMRNIRVLFFCIDCGHAHTCGTCDRIVRIQGVLRGGQN